MELIHRTVKNFSVKEILEGIKEHDNTVLEFIYYKFFKEIRQYIYVNTGSEEDAKDIFQEAIIVIYNRVKKNNLDLTCSFNTYLYSVCRILWLKQLKRKRQIIENEEFSESEVNNEDLEAMIKDHEKYGLYEYHFKKLGDDCKKILKLFFKNRPLKEIAEIMGYSSENYAKKKKYQCKQYLVKCIMEDPKYKELVYE